MVVTKCFWLTPILLFFIFFLFWFKKYKKWLSNMSYYLGFSLVRQDLWTCRLGECLW
ncbi:hypothetical protein Mapa_010377 [Marchantia paleacea]|nr:hypothetical protein Mapa_010377 [Marchantia paleacea]